MGPEELSEMRDVKRASWWRRCQFLAELPVVCSFTAVRGNCRRNTTPCHHVYSRLQHCKYRRVNKRRFLPTTSSFAQPIRCIASRYSPQVLVLSHATSPFNCLPPSHFLQPECRNVRIHYSFSGWENGSRLPESATAKEPWSIRKLTIP